MKIKSFLIISIIAISLLAFHCSRGQSPFSSDAALNQQAVLNGTFVLAETNTAGFGAIQIGVKGTSLYTNPDGNGDFRIDDLPLGNIFVEVTVESDTSDIRIDNVQSGEEIRITVKVKSNNHAVLANMERKKKFSGDLQAQIQPKKWNLNWVDSEINFEDVVIAKISGDGYDQIMSGSVKLVGPDGDTIGSFEEDIGGTYFIAKFHQRDAIGIINEPVPGMDYGIKVEYVKDSQTLYLPPEADKFIMIEIVGKSPRDSEELSIQVNPTKWNTNWEKSSGTVMVKFWGDGYEEIDDKAVFMVGPEDSNGIESVRWIKPIGSNPTDDHLIVKFSKMEAISIIPEPTPGKKYVIRITDNPDGSGVFSFDCAIEIVGSKK